MLSPTDNLAATLSATILYMLQHLAAAKNKQIFITHLVRTQSFPIISDYSGCILNLPKTNGDVSITSDFTDISKCFESIPIDATREDSLQSAL